MEFLSPERHIWKPIARTSYFPGVGVSGQQLFLTEGDRISSQGGVGGSVPVFLWKSIAFVIFQEGQAPPRLWIRIWNARIEIQIWASTE